MRARVERALRPVPAPALRRASSTAPADGDVELVDDDDAGPRPGAEPQLTGWRKLLAPPPPKRAGAATARTATARRRRRRRDRRPARADDRAARRACSSPSRRARGMAMLFDIAVLLGRSSSACSFVAARGRSRATYPKQIDKLDSIDDADRRRSTRPTTQPTTATTPRRDKRQGRGPEGASTRPTTDSEATGRGSKTPPSDRQGRRQEGRRAAATASSAPSTRSSVTHPRARPAVPRADRPR